MQSPKLRSWLTLSLLPGMNARIINSLLETFSSPEAILGINSPNLRSADLPAKVAETISGLRKGRYEIEVHAKVRECLDWEASEERNEILCLESDNYPPLLKEIHDPPPVLFIKGASHILSLPGIAMVGSRKPGPVGRKNARHLAQSLARAGYLITSGLAQGIDAECHKGALSAGGKTVAVLGSGIDRVYPAGHAGLSGEISANGVLVSEFPPGTPPLPWHFPQRNRIVSGLSHGTVVVEAAIRSGSLITARFALEQGREVFAIPGSINNATSKGCHQLIRTGAKLVETTKDIIEELRPFYDMASEQLESQAPATSINQEEKTVLDNIGYDPVTVNQLVDSTSISIERLNAVLVTLEIRGQIQAVPGGFISSVT